MKCKLDGDQDLLFLQAKNILLTSETTPNQNGILYFQYNSPLSTTITQLKFYICICVYYLKQPSHLTNYLTFVMKDTAFDIRLFLQALRSLSLFYMDHKQYFKFVKNVYLSIYAMDVVKVKMIGQCSMSEEIQQMIETIKDSSGNSLKDRKTAVTASWQINKIDYQFLKNIGYIKISLLLSQVKADMNFVKLQAIWTQMIDLIGFNDLDVVKIFFISTQKMLRSQFNQLCLFFIRKFIDKIGLDALLNLLIGKLYSANQQNGQTIIQSAQLYQVMQNYTCKAIQWQNPIKLTVKTLALMIKARIIQYTSVSFQLTPSMSFLLKFAENRVNLHLVLCKQYYQRDLSELDQNKTQIWGQLLLSSKLQLMTQLIQLNSYNQFKHILQKQKIKLDLIYHPPLIHAFSLLLEWIIHPLYKVISPAQFFKQQSVTLNFPKGFFTQCFTVSNKFIESIAEILNTAKFYVLAKRSTFVKLCRIFSVICSKRSELLIQQFDVQSKIITFIYNVLKKYLLPSIQFYYKDPTVSYQLHNLVDYFLYKIQTNVYFVCSKQRQLTNLHLCHIYNQTSIAQNKYLNNVDQKNKQKIIKKMGMLMSCQIFSSLDQIFKRVIINCQGFESLIVAAIQSTPILTRKIAFFFILMYLSQNEQNQNLIKSDGLITTMYHKLIDITKLFLMSQKSNEEYINILLQYLFFNRQPTNANKSSFQIFHGELFMINEICQNLIICDMTDDCIKDRFRIFVNAGPFLKIKIMNKIDEFYNKRYIRRNLVRMLLSGGQSIENSIFYKIILNLSYQLTRLLQNKTSKPSISGCLHDQIYQLVIFFINILHFEAPMKDCEWLVSIDRFKPLVTQYALPYELAFHVTRKSIFNKICFGGENFTEESNWKAYKLQIIDPLFNHLRQKSLNLVQKCKSLKIPSFGSKQIKQFVNRDVFLLFWIQDIEYAFLNQIYKNHLKELDNDIKKLQKGKKKQFLLKFYTETMREQARYKKVNNIIIFGKDGQEKQLSQIYINRQKVPELMPQNSHMKNQLRQFIQMFMKYCIFRRAFISKGDAYYCSVFLINLFRINYTPIVTIMKAITHAMNYITSYLQFSTQRQASDILPLLFSSLTSIFNDWCSRNRLNERLFTFRLIKEEIDMDTFDQLLYLLYKCNRQMLDRMFRNRSQAFFVKNCITFIYKSKYFPFCYQHIDEIMNYLDDVEEIFADQVDVLRQVSGMKYQIRRREKICDIKILKKSIINRYKLQHEPVFIEQKQSSFLNEDKQVSYNTNNKSQSIIKDPLKYLDYPTLSDTCEDHEPQMQQNNQKYIQSSSSPLHHQQISKIDHMFSDSRKQFSQSYISNQCETQNANKRKKQQNRPKVAKQNL